jgi:hypothetical protein
VGLLWVMNAVDDRARSVRFTPDRIGIATTQIWEQSDQA